MQQGSSRYYNKMCMTQRGVNSDSHSTYPLGRDYNGNGVAPALY